MSVGCNLHIYLYFYPQNQQIRDPRTNSSQRVTTSLDKLIGYTYRIERLRHEQFFTAVTWFSAFFSGAAASHTAAGLQQTLSCCWLSFSTHDLAR